MPIAIFLNRRQTKRRDLIRIDHPGNVILPNTKKTLDEQRLPIIATLLRLSCRTGISGETQTKTRQRRDKPWVSLAVSGSGIHAMRVSA